MSLHHRDVIVITAECARIIFEERYKQGNLNGKQLFAELLYVSQWEREELAKLAAPVREGNIVPFERPQS